MQIIAVDTNKHSLLELVKCLETVYQGSTIIPFFDPMSAVKFGFNHKIDMVFTEIPMRGVDGFKLAKLIWKHNEDMEIYFVTETIDYANEAFQMKASDYLLKPITTEKLKGRIESQSSKDIAQKDSKGERYESSQAER